MGANYLRRDCNHREAGANYLRMEKVPPRPENEGLVDKWFSGLSVPASRILSVHKLVPKTDAVEPIISTRFRPHA